ncbi:cAMP dependent protein kinase regulatory subunit type I II alpha beta [Echinococcus multilocularis]|uniref:cAMP dependent protein kinase regulatory subunit type I II alpha beta n=1 Tax=Echinococcus multilocularis TaxID=6211 RepID=A0A068Y2X1_ECHMU|nr:cAMP dependent protein kinase regulatory subunit type I II alpha beta [Echinococcus multilocularis]
MSICDRPRLPEGFQELLEELSYEVMVERPADVIQFSIDFFKSRRGPNGTCISKKAASRRASDDPLGNDRSLHLSSCPRDKFTQRPQ